MRASGPRWRARTLMELVTFVIAVAVMVFTVPGMTVAIAIVVPSEMLPAFATIAFFESIAVAGIGAAIAVTAIVVPVNVTPEALAAVIPGTSAYEDAIGEPLGAIVAVRSTIVRRIVEVSIWAGRCGTDLH